MKKLMMVSIFFAALATHAGPVCRGAYFDGHNFTQDGAIWTQLGELPFNKVVKVPGANREVTLSFASDTFMLSLSDGTNTFGLARAENQAVHSKNTKINLDLYLNGVWEQVEAYCTIAP